MFIPVLAMESCDRACVGSFAFDVAVFQRFGDKIHNNAKSPITSDKETFYFILFQGTDVNHREAWVSGSERSGKFKRKHHQTG